MAKEELNFVEMFYISLLSSRYPKGYNLTDGGDWVFDFTGTSWKSDVARLEKHKQIRIGKKHPPRSLEWREKQRHARLGKKLSEEHRKKISEGHKGLSNGMLGKKHKPSTIEKMRASHALRAAHA